MAINNQKSVLITGANGFLGSTLMKSLMSSFAVNCLVRDPNFRSENAAIFYFHEYGDEAVEQAVSRSNIIVHCAAMLHGKKKPMWNANVMYSRRLLNLAEKHSIAHFIFISSENVQQQLSDLYTTTKRVAEEDVKKYKNHTILRPTVLYGPGDSKYVTRLIHIIKGYPMVPILGNGENRFQFMYIDDLVKIITSSIVKGIYGTYVVAGPQSVTYRSFMTQVLNCLELRKPVVKLPTALLKPFSYVLEAFLSSPPLTHTQLENLKKDRNYNIARIVRLFEYVPTPLDVGLKKLIAQEG
jgi:nucleoside-diphosphate-sugar epimerase